MLRARNNNIEKSMDKSISLACVRAQKLLLEK